MLDGFKEFTDPLEKDYDLKVSDNDSLVKSPKSEQENPTRELFNQLYCQLGLPEDFELEPFGITAKEISNPTLETIKKLKEYASSTKDEQAKRR